MTKVTVTKNVPIKGDPFFRVKIEDETVGIFYFKIGQPEGSLYNEEINRQSAMALAAKIENGDKETEEIIYQTPDN